LSQFNVTFDTKFAKKLTYAKIEKVN